MKTMLVDKYTVLLDDYDWLRFCRMKWKIRSPKDGAKYICCNKTVTLQNGCRARKTIYLHRAVLCPPYGLEMPTEIEGHHKNTNTLDNQRENLEEQRRDKHGKITRAKQQ